MDHLHRDFVGQVDHLECEWGDGSMEEVFGHGAGLEDDALVVEGYC